MASRIQIAAHEPPRLLPLNFFDRRADAAKLAVRDKKVRKKLSGRTRLWDQITGITWHQTAVQMGERPGRYDSMGAHIAITQQGKVIWVHDFDKIVYHANGFNNRTIGIEVVGAFPGITGDLSRRSFWRPKERPNMRPTKLTDECVQACHDTSKWIVEMVKRHGGKLKFMLAHRQSSGTRRNDPGEEIWQRCVMPMMKKYKLTHGGKSFKIDKGRPIPENWDEKQVGIKF